MFLQMYPYLASPCIHFIYYICPLFAYNSQFFSSMAEDLKKMIGERLQLLRLEKRLTQEQMSERLHISTSAYCKIEYGETDLTLSRLNKIAEILDMSAGELFGRINGNASFQNCQGLIGYTQHNEHINLGASDDLRELLKANGRLVDVLLKRVEQLEKAMEEMAKK